jgi:predicted ATP-dependent serine protease
MALWGREVVYRCRHCGRVTEVEQPYCFVCGTWESLAALPRRELEAGTALAQRMGGWLERARDWLLGPVGGAARG